MTENDYITLGAQLFLFMNVCIAVMSGFVSAFDGKGFHPILRLVLFIHATVFVVMATWAILYLYEHPHYFLETRLTND